jgi:hypothetical protein
MPKRPTPIRLDENLVKSLDRFVEAWNRSGAPSTNRTLVITTAIEQYLKAWRGMLKKRWPGQTRRPPKEREPVLNFPIRSGQQGVR